jgi:flagellar hook protein FlgE
MSLLASMTSAVSGLDAFQEQMDTIGNNIANVDTTGFKSVTTTFADSFSNTLRVATGATSTTSGASSIQIGTGVSITSTPSNWAQGATDTTGIDSNLAIVGNGFFTVTDSVTGNQYLTRDGEFKVDAAGYLVTATGERVQGLSGGTSAAAPSVQGSIKIDASGAVDPSAGMLSYAINGQGNITVNMADGTAYVCGQVSLVNVADPSALIKEGNNLFSGQALAGATGPLAPGTAGLGTIQSGAVESSNVDLSNEMANLITAQRAFEANSKIITTSDEMLQTLVNMKR